MKSTGIVRKVDDLGRVVLPKELRKVLEIKERTPLEIFTEGDRIILKRYEPNCIFCGSNVDVRTFKEHNICKACENELSTAR